MVILSGIRKAAVRTLPAAAFSLLLPFQLQAQSQYFSPVLLDQAERVDQSSEAFPWIYMGSGTREVARTSQTIGCAGTYPNGAPARVRCPGSPSAGSILGPQYICTAVTRPKHVGDVAIGTLNISTTSTGMSDGHNVDGCLEPYVGTTMARTSSNSFSLAGGRWACPSGTQAIDINFDGNKFGNEELPYRYNPEMCGVHYCPAGSALAFDPANARASLYFGNPGYVCSGNNEEKQPCDCPKVGDPIVVATGNSAQSETDFSTGKPGGLLFTRYYNSKGSPEIGGNFSKGWNHTYQSKLAGASPYLDYTSTNTLAFVNMIRPNGETQLFLSSGTAINHGTEFHVAWIGDADNPEYSLLQILDSDLEQIAWEYTSEEDAVERYDVDGRLLRITNRAGMATQMQYDVAVSAGGDGNAATLDKVTDFHGDKLVLAYDTDKRLISMTDPDGHQVSYTYAANGNLVQARYPDLTPADSADNPVRVYHYENVGFPNLLTGITDENADRFVTWHFDGSKRALYSEFAGNVGKEELTYLPAGNASVTNPLGKVTNYLFTSVQGVKVPVTVERLASSLSPAATQSNTYDAAGNVLSRTDWNGNATHYSYDLLGRETSRTEAAGTPQERTVTTAWHPSLRLPTLIAEPGRTTALTYDSQGNLLTRTETDVAGSASRTWTYTYHPQGVNGAFQMATMDGPRTDVSDITTYSYSAAGLVATITNPAGHVTQVTSYNARGLPLQMTDANNVVTQMSYHPRGWLLSSIVLDPTGAGNHAATLYEYDKVGQMTKVTLPNGAFLNYEYDAAHRLTAISNNLDERQEFALDAAGNITQESIRNAAGTITRTQQTVYDELSRIYQTIGGAAQIAQRGYDSNGNETLIALDPSGLNQRTLQAFDALNRLHTATDALNNQSEYKYDARDNLIEVTDQRDLTTVYSYDGLNNLVQLISPDTGITTYTYDDAGNQRSQTDARGVVTQYTYDALNRLTAVTYPGSPSESITYAYDQPSAGYGVGRLGQLTDQTGTTSFAYDHRGNQLQSSVTILGNSYTTAYAYDLADNLVRTTYPSGRVVNHQLDVLGRTAAVTTAQNSGATVQNVATAITYLPFGPAQSLSYGNNLALSLGIDADYRLSSLAVESTGGAGSSVLDLTYTQNTVDNITAITDAVNANRSQAFIYDQLNRLLSADGSYGIQGYTYDPVGNRLTLTASKDGSTSVEAYTYDTASNRLLTVAVDGVLRTLQYDSAGNIIGDDRGAETGFDLEYNAQNRLIEATPQQQGAAQ
jgi:YD repeat-containing protein